jgi:hypothetical protein
MSAQSKLPKDGAQIVLWFRGLPQPSVFVTTRAEADRAMEDYQFYTDFDSLEDELERAAASDSTQVTPRKRPARKIEFMSYPDGSGTRSRTVVPIASLRALTIEFPTIQLAS